MGARQTRTKPRHLAGLAAAASFGLATALISIGCGQGGGPPASRGPVETAPSQEAGFAILSEEQIQEAIDVRTRYGLRSDLTWIRAVAANPAAQIGMEEYGIPLMPDEFADLMNRRWDPNLHLQVSDYGRRFPEDFAGAWINMKANGVIIAFKNNVDHHRDALLTIVPEGSALEVMEVERSLEDLLAFVDLVEADKAWFDSIGLVARASEYVLDNTVHVRFEGPEEAAGVIAEHFGHPSWLKVEWGGPLPWTGPRADLTIKITDSNGRPVTGLQCDIAPVDPSVDLGGEPVGGIEAAGICELKSVPIAVYEIKVRESVENDHDDLVPIKTLRVALKPGGTEAHVVVPAP